MEANIGDIDRTELSPESKDTALCIECRKKGLNLCDIDEICQLRLASALGDKKYSVISNSIDYAGKKGLIDIRTVKVKGNRPKQFIKITEQGKMFFGIVK